VWLVMDNHYHLLLRTPRGNLSRAMRHLNGVYTQRYNRIQKTDGPLYRGRYKAILIDVDAYLLNVSRYIHRNPIEARIVRRAERYPWSSYSAYIGKSKAPLWLCMKDTLGMIGQRNRQQRYQTFVEEGIDEDTAAFYQKKKQAPILGRESFIARKTNAIAGNIEQPESRRRAKEIALDTIVEGVVQVFQVEREEIFHTPRGRGQENHARSAALYVSRKTAGLPLTNIAEYFGLGHYGSVSGANSRFEARMADDKQLLSKVMRLNKTINK
jgi:putative transposase